MLKDCHVEECAEVGGHRVIVNFVYFALLQDEVPSYLKREKVATVKLGSRYKVTEVPIKRQVVLVGYFHSTGHS